MTNDKKKPSEKNTRKPITNKIIRWMWITFFSMLVLGFITLALIYNGAFNGFFGHMPPIEDLKNPKDKYASVIYAADGPELGRYFRNTGNRVYVDLDDVSQHVIDALIATEDVRFHEHSGIDMRAMLRVIVKTLLLQQKNAGGGSTITQQLAKQLYSPPSNDLLKLTIYSGLDPLKEYIH